MTSDESRPKLTYFNVKGRAQALRWALRILGVDFVDNLISGEWFYNEIAPKSPNGYVPILEHKGKTYADTLCILRYISAHMVPDNTSLMPETDLDDLHAVAAFCLANSLPDAGLAVVRYAKDEKKEEAFKECFTKTCPEILRTLDAHIAVHQDSLGHIVSHKLTYIDLYVAGGLMELLSTRLFLVPEIDSLLPHGLQTLRRVLSHPAVRKFEYEFGFKNPILSYFNVPARGEAIRLCLSIGGVAFEDKTYDISTWKSVPNKVTPTGQLPMIEFEDKFFVVETEAILNWAGEKTGLTPTTFQGKARANALYSRMQPVTYFWRYIRESADTEVTKKLVIDEAIPKALGVIDRLIPATATWCADVKLTWIDVYLASQWKVLVARELLTNEKDATKYPQIHRIYKQVYDLPVVKKYFDSLSGDC